MTRQFLFGAVAGSSWTVSVFIAIRYLNAWRWARTIRLSPDLDELRKMIEGPGPLIGPTQ